MFHTRKPDKQSAVVFKISIFFRLINNWFKFIIIHEKSIFSYRIGTVGWSSFWTKNDATHSSQRGFLFVG